MDRESQPCEPLPRCRTPTPADIGLHCLVPSRRNCRAVLDIRFDATDKGLKVSVRQPAACSSTGLVDRRSHVDCFGARRRFMSACRSQRSGFYTMLRSRDRSPRRWNNCAACHGSVGSPFSHLRASLQLGHKQTFTSCTRCATSRASSCPTSSFCAWTGPTLQGVLTGSGYS